MNRAYIAVLDSGVGGLSVLTELIKKFPNRQFLYLGDNGNAPYGRKSRRELLSLAIKNVNVLKEYNVEAIVLGCNTLSVNLISDIKDYSGLPVFGVFPPVEKYLSEGKKVLLLATERTAEKYRGVKNLHTVGLKNLVKDIENNLFNLSAVNFEKNLLESVGEFVDKKGYYDTVILGCTHYVFLKNKISDHFCPKNLTSGNIFAVEKLKKYLLNKKSLVNYSGFELKFVGKWAKTNEKFYVLGGQNALKIR